MGRYARNALAGEGVQVPWSDELGGYEVDFGTAKSPGAFERLHGWLRWVRPIRSVTIASDPELIDLAPLHGVIEPGELTQLTIYNNDALQAIGLQGLANLNQLTISDNAALQAIGLQRLATLSQLNITSNGALQAIDGLGKLPRLEELRIDGPILPAALTGVARLPRLERLMLPVGQEEATLNRLKALPNVEIRFVEPGTIGWLYQW